MLLDAKDLLIDYKKDLLERRKKLSFQPVVALVWVGDDKQTEKFINTKIKLAKELDCELRTHHFPKIGDQQIEALMQTLNNNKGVNGIVVQLPLPKNVNADRLINFIDSNKDIDNLKGENMYISPTPNATIELLHYHNIVIKNVVILGYGKLVGKPLSEMFDSEGIKYDLIKERAEEKTEFIKNHDILISATGRANIISPEMVNENMVVIDASGIDVDVPTIEPFVKAVTPPKGAIGPLTVCGLFDNLLTACGV